jgi:glycine dehydrogenase subunit 2
MNNSRLLEPLIFELSDAGLATDYLPPLDVPESTFDLETRGELPLPEVDEHSVVRHFTRLSQQNFSIDTEFYPLGSCTMKYNPKINETIVSLPGFAGAHPLLPEHLAQGWLEVLFEAQRILASIAGLDAATVQPCAGASGEFCGLLMIRKYHESRGEGEKRRRIVVPDSAHGTNPASAARCGYKVTQVASTPEGCVDLAHMKEALGNDVAAVMITNPNTLGVFEKDITALCEMAHECGALVYMDGANMNAILGQARPGDFGIDVMHFNVHKTFSTPHGGGGPGAGPVAVRAFLEPFLPVPHVVKRESTFAWDDDRPQSIGTLHAFYGNSGIILRALAYILRHGAPGLQQISENAVLAANYILARLKSTFEAGSDNLCKHECVLSASELKKQYGVSAWDVAKRLPDYGFHAPTVYFPTIVKESMMIEPTETETKATLDAFCDAMLAIAEEARTNPDLLHHAPHSLAVGRLDEAHAAKCLNLCWRSSEESE